MGGWETVLKIAEQVKEANPGRFVEEEIDFLATHMVLSLNDHMIFNDEDYNTLMNQVKKLNPRGQRRWKHRVWDEEKKTHIIVNFDPKSKVIFANCTGLPLIPVNISAQARSQGDSKVAQATIDMFNATRPPKNAHEAFSKAHANATVGRIARAKDTSEL